MGAIALCLRVHLRQRRRGWFALAALLGVIGGIALGAACGAQRTSTAYPRFLRQSHAADLSVSPTRSGFHGYFRAVGRLPQVALSAPSMFLQMAVAGPDASPYSGLVAQASPYGGEGSAIDRVKVLAGSMFNPADPRAVVINSELADAERVRVGGTLRLLGYPQRGGNADLAHPERLAFHVSAIVDFGSQIVSASGQRPTPWALFSPAFARTSQAQSFNPAGGADSVLLRAGADAAAFERAATALAAAYRVGEVQIVHLANGYAAGNRAIEPQAMALWIFAALVGLIAFVLIGQLLSRQLALDEGEAEVVRALGMSRGALAGLSAAKVALVTAAGAAGAVAVAVGASPLMPIGLAREAEPSPGIDVNLAILALGFAAIACAPLLLTSPALVRAAWRVRAPGVPEPFGTARSSRLGSGLGRAGSLPGGLGVRMAFEPGRGRSAVPVRSAMVGTTAALAAIVAAIVFGASFLQLIGTPARYGQNWALQLDMQVGSAPLNWAAKFLGGSARLAEYAGGTYGQVSIVTPAARTAAVPAIGLDELQGRGFLTLLAGRAPARPGEIALGAHTLRSMGLHVGQQVRVGVNGTTSTMRIVGTAVFAAFSVGGSSATDLGTGAAVSASVLSQPNPPFCSAPQTCYNFFLLRYRPGIDMRAAAARMADAVTRAGCPKGLCLVTADQRPADIRLYSGVRNTPLALGAVLALLGLGTLAHVLTTGVSRRRRDLALLKTLGMTRGQLLRVVSWQASALSAAALVIGVPLGMIAGRWAWRWFAGSVGVGEQAQVPAALVLATLPLTVALAVLIAAAPGWAAARIRPAAVLRSE